MRIGIIGAGFTGLAAAYYLGKKGHEVSLFEKDEKPGGLAVGYKERGWEWSTEKHYHHWFTNDNSVLSLAQEVNFKVGIHRPKTSAYVDGAIYPLNSPIDVLLFPKLSLVNRLRMGTALAYLKLNPFWKPLETIKAHIWLRKYMGGQAFEKIWEPLFLAKFGEFKDEVPLSWFWARIKKRTPSLAYPKGGFLAFATALQKIIEKNGGHFYYNTEVKQLSVLSGRLSEVSSPVVSFSVSKPENRKPIDQDLKTENGEPITKTAEFDAVIVTLPSFFFVKIAPSLPSDYKGKLLDLKGLGAINLVLRLTQPFLEDGTYWLNVCEKQSPVMAVVEHTNFIDPKYYNNERIVYLGTYLPRTDPRFAMSADELLALYDPWLKQINSNYKSSIINYKLFKASFAQPIIPLNYSKILPPFETPMSNVYLANIQQVYPWDRGTNYAVELGKKIAKKLINDQAPIHQTNVQF